MNFRPTKPQSRSWEVGGYLCGVRVVGDDCDPLQEVRSLCLASPTCGAVQSH